MPSRARRGLFVVSVVVIVAVGGALGLRALWNAATSSGLFSGCSVGSYSLTTDQAAIASTMVGVATRRNLPERASVLSLAAALQESKLQNLPINSGDRDSVGVLQQRPSQGWGTAAQLNDVHYATGAFLDALVKLSGWQEQPLAEAVQAVQVSADGSAYAKHESEAQALADALTGATPAGISCSFAKSTVVATTAKVAAQVSRDLPVHTPVTTTRTVTVPGAHWQTAAWFVANADRLGIESVAYNGKTWTRGGGWKPSHAPASAVVATMYQP
jgi:hypothetical protein